MTNAEIIKKNREALVEAGIISEEETIHTYQAWQSLGMQVKKGSKAIAQFSVWKKSKVRTVATETDENGNERELKKGGNFFMQKASFFSSSQVEAIGA